MRFARAHAANTGRKVQVVVTTAEASSSSTSAADPSASVGGGSSDEPLNSLSILWEADPARAPGVFESIPSLSGDVADVSELVEIRSVGRESKNSESHEDAATLDSQGGGNSQMRTSSFRDSLDTSSNSLNLGDTFAANTTSDSDVSSEGFSDTSSRSFAERTNPGEATITFYPDGSCDGATIVLASRDSDDSREVAVHLESVTGTTRRRWKEAPSASAPGSEYLRSSQQTASRMADSASTTKARR